MTTPDGVTFIRDDFKAPLWTVDPAEFMRPRAQRKIIVIGTLSAYGTSIEKNMPGCAARSESADVTFVGQASHVLEHAIKRTARCAFSHVGMRPLRN